MAIAETAELIARLSLQDQMSAGLRTATGGLQNAQQAVQRVGGHLGGLRTLTSGVGGAFQHAAGRVGMLTKAFGLGGLAGGIIGVVGFFKGAIDEARQFGNVAEGMASTLVSSRSSAQLLIGTFKQFGVEGDAAQKIVGMLLKNVGNLSLTSEGASGFMQKFGFNIQTATGQIKDANTLIQDFTDYWNNKTIPAEQKVAAGAALFGRNWQAMLEILQSGSGAWRDATQLAKDLGLANEDLTEQAERNEAAMLRWNTVLDALKITIGAEVLPLLTELAEQATRFVRDNRTDITHFFRNLRDAAKDAIGFITGTVLPTFGDLASKANNFWNSVPAPLRDLLTKGIIADRTIKFLFGFSLADVGKNILSGALDLFARQFIMRGSTPANPLFVVDIAPGKGGVPGVPGAGGMGLLGTAGALGTIAAGAYAVADQIGRLPTLMEGINAAQSARTITDARAAVTTLMEGITVAQPWKAWLPSFLNFLAPERPILGPPAPRPGADQYSGPIGPLPGGGMLPGQVTTRGPVDVRDAELRKVIPFLGAGITRDLQKTSTQLTSTFAQRMGEVREQLVAQGREGASLRRGLLERMGISQRTLDRLHTVMRGEVAKTLGISVQELRNIKRSSDHNEEIIAGKLGITVEQLRLIRDRARETASGVLQLNRKDFSPEVTVNVKTSVTTRDVTRSVGINTRYGKFAT